MNDSVIMYKIRPIIKLTNDIEIPKCMYKMKNIQESFFTNRMDPEITILPNASSISEKNPLPEVSALECHQEDILEQLAQLKELMTTLRIELKSTLPTATCKMLLTPTICSSAKSDVVHDIVINANPCRPPYSILGLMRLWGDSLKMRINCHVHSTVTLLPDNVAGFLPCETVAFNHSDSPLLNVTLVWKDVGLDTEMVVSPMKHIPIRGEVNILRYLTRLGPPQFNYELDSPEVSTKVDYLLDTCHCLTRCQLVKDKQASLRSLNAQLDKALFYGKGNAISAADLAAWSAIRQLGYTEKDLTVNMKKWFKCCTEILKL